MNLKEQKYVCTLAETGSLTLAAKRLYISQPALSLYITNLEASLGIKLFDRVGKRFVLTYAGELYVEKAWRMLELKEIFDIEMANISSGYKERLRVSMQEIRSAQMVPQLVPAFFDRYPNVALTWHEGNYRSMEERLLNNQIDIFFCNCPIRRKEFSYITICTDHPVLAVHRDHPNVKKAVSGGKYPWIDLTLFKDDRFILQHEGQSIRAFSDRILEECGLRPKNVFLLRKILTMLSLINEGFGVGFCMETYFHYACQADQISLFHVGHSKKSIEFAAVFQKGRSRELPPYALELVEMVRENVLRIQEAKS